MKYIEDSTQELKREITNVIKKEIVAFLNTFGGTIFVGVNDDGSIYWNLTEKQRDVEQTKIINWIIGGVFSPDCKEFIDLQWNSDGVLEIHVAQGDQKPYYLTEKGCNSKGCFLRFETSKMPASKADIKRMKLQSQEIYYEDEISTIQDLTFSYLTDKAVSNNVRFNPVSYGFLKHNKYTNLAYILSDQFKIRSKLYLVDNKNNIIKKKQWGGSILHQVDQIYEYLNQNIKDGYSTIAIYEGLLNAFIHCDWHSKENIRIEWSPSKINFISPGGIFHLSFEEAQDGKRSNRNPKLASVFEKLMYSNRVGFGFNKIYTSCQKLNVEPIVITTSSHFILSIPKSKKK